MDFYPWLGDGLVDCYQSFDKVRRSGNITANQGDLRICLDKIRKSSLIRGDISGCKLTHPNLRTNVLVQCRRSFDQMRRALGISPRIIGISEFTSIRFVNPPRFAVISWRKLTHQNITNGVLALIALVLFGLFTSCTASAITNQPLSEVITSLHLDAPAVIQAGAPVKITVTTNTAISDLRVRLLLIEAYGTTALEQWLSNGVATFILEPTLTQTAGRMGLLAQIESVRETGAIMIEPGLPVEPILTLVGPRSLTADGEHWAMLVAVPQDRYDNPVADTTPVIVRTLHPPNHESRITNHELGITNYELGITNYINAANGDLEILTATTQHLLAWARIYTRTKAGRMTMAANAGSAHSPERMVLAVPGAPIPFSLAADPIHLAADGQQLLTVHTDTLVDQFGNQLMDGMNVTFVVEDTNGASRSLPAQIINGQAAVKVQAPTDAGLVTIRAFVLDTESSPLSLTFADGLAVDSFPVTVTVSAESLAIRAGPLVGQLGQYIPDGSPVTFHLVAIDNEPNAAPLTVTAQSDMGFAIGYIRRYGLAPGSYQVTATVGVGRGETTLVLAK